MMFVFYKKLILILFSVGFISCIACFFAARHLFQDFEIKPKNGLIIEDGSALVEEEVEKISEAVPNQKETVDVSTKQKVISSTKLIFQSYNQQEELVEEREEMPPYFLLDLTLSELQKYYPEWLILSFSDQEVVMRKNIEEENHYIVGEQDGYITVFYEKEKNGVSIHEKTDTPVSSLSHEEQIRLNDGIVVIGEERLARILEDYES